jgi:hypothetical protein
VSIVRILIGVIVGGGILAALLVAAVRFPAVAGFLMFGTAGCGLLYVAYHGLRTGIISARRSRYERTSSPLGFWFYILFYALIGTFVFGYGVYSVLHPVLARK